jgi:putative FmdB family regulatory protein
MHKWKLPIAFVVAAVAVAILAISILPSLTSRTPTYDWQCAQCQHRFRLAVPDAAADVPVVTCPQCNAQAAERLMHFQCRNCWNKYDLRGSQASLANIVCPECGSRAARDLDHPIPGDDEPVEGGQPYPVK